MTTPLKFPDAALVIQGAILKAMRDSAPIVKNSAIGNVNRMLKRTGRLASSVYASVRKFQGGGKLTIGTPLLYGRFWEYGFMRGRGLARGAGRSHRRRSVSEQARLIKGGAKFYRRTWLGPALYEAMPEVTRRIEMQLNEAMKEYGGSHTIDIKFGR